MSYAVLEQKLRLVSEKDFEFVSRFLDLVVSNNRVDTRKKQRIIRNVDYLAMLDRSWAQFEAGEVVVKSMSQLRAMESD